MHDYRAIFLDIDGTLTQPGHSAPPVSAVAAIESARRAGRRVFLCTGRCEAMLKPLLHCADFDGYVASSGGLVVVGSRDVFDCPMTPQEQAHVLTALSDNGVFRTVQTRMGAYCDEGFRDFLRARDVQNGSSELLRWREAIEQRLHRCSPCAITAANPFIPSCACPRRGRSWGAPWRNAASSTSY